MSETKNSKSAEDAGSTKKQLEERLAEATSSETLSDIASTQDTQKADRDRATDNMTATPDGQFDNNRNRPDDTGPM